jgi:multiple sugar transport system substrate-binding protein
MNIASILTDSRKLIYILGGAIAVMVFVTIIFIMSNTVGSSTAEAKLVVWGVFDNPAAFDQAIKDYQKANKGINVTYRLVPSADYEATLLDAMAANQAPDIFMIHNTWLPKQINKIAPMPATLPSTKAPLMTVRQFQDTFVDVAANDLISDGKIYGLPLYADTLALYYNKNMFASAGIAQPPKTWDEFSADVKLLTKFDASRNILKSGAAIGSARNINRSTDIMMMLMLQSGTQMVDADHAQATFAHSVDGQPIGQIALNFYTDFTNPQKEVYTWNDNQHYSIDAFVGEETAMMFNYSHQIPVVRSRAPRLNFGIAPVPQASTADQRTFANYWSLSVWSGSKHPNEAWQFAYYMTADAGNVSYLNSANRPAARRALIDQQKNDPDLGVFAEQALTARSWYQVDNGAIETIFADMIDNVDLGRKSPADAIKEAESKVSVLMTRK